MVGSSMTTDATGYSRNSRYSRYVGYGAVLRRWKRLLTVDRLTPAVKTAEQCHRFVSTMLPGDPNQLLPYSTVTYGTGLDAKYGAVPYEYGTVVIIPTIVGIMTKP